MKVSAVVENDLNYICEQANSELLQLREKRVLIVGGAGFLGYYLVQSLVWFNKLNNVGIKITVLDNFKRGRPDWLDALQKEGAIEVFEADITKALDDRFPPSEFVIHAASIASPIFYRQYPIETMDANVNGLRNLLNYSLRCRDDFDANVEGFLYFSTSEIYGDPSPEFIPTREEYRGFVSCTGPRACYDESKRYGETLSVNFAKVYDLEIKIARPFNNFGPGLKISDGRVISDFSKNILSNENIMLFSDGTPTRTFCYVADAIVGYFKVLVRGRKAESYNIGIEDPEISIREFAKMMREEAAELFNYQGEVVFANSEDEFYLTDNPNRRCPSILKARNHLDFNPQISLRDGLNRSLRWYEENPL